jgi:L-rhamnose-H+ transport protein
MNRVCLSYTERAPDSQMKPMATEVMSGKEAEDVLQVKGKCCNPNENSRSPAGESEWKYPRCVCKKCLGYPPMNPFAGVLLIAAGGLAAGSFYIPLKKVRDWAWESGWLANGLFAWVIAPWAVAYLSVPGLWGILKSSPGSSLVWSYIFGLLWGVGGLTFGLSMRYLGMSLGYSLALGCTAAFGTIIPPVYYRTFLQMLRQPSGLVTLAGVMVCLAGIGVVGRAGRVKEKRLTTEQKKASVREFDFRKGFFIALLCGVMSACFAFGIAAGKPIAARAVAAGAAPLWQNGPVFVVVMAGGFTTNFLWCLFLSLKNRSARDYVNRRGSPLAANYFFAALAGVTWYVQFMFYGMGATKMGKYDFSSWSILMAFTIVFSNLWGLALKEWKGSNKRIYFLIGAGIVILILSTVVIGAGNFLAARGK